MTDTLDTLDELDALFGPDAHSIDWWQMVLRAIVVLVYLLILIRIGRRAFGQNTAFDIAASVLLGSMLSRVITANAEIGPTFAAAGVLVLLHAVLAWVTFRSGRAGALLKGREVQLIRGGELQREAMRRASVTENDLCEALRTTLGLEDLGEVESAYLERSGRISLVRKRA